MYQSKGCELDPKQFSEVDHKKFSEVDPKTFGELNLVNLKQQINTRQLLLGI